MLCEETIKTAYKEPIAKENKESWAKLEAYAQNIREITKKITPNNYVECDNEYIKEIKSFDNVIFFDQGVAKNEPISINEKRAPDRHTRIYRGQRASLFLERNV